MRRWCLALVAALVAVTGRPGRSEASFVFTPSGFIEETVVSGLPLATGVTFAPDGRMFIALKAGVVRVYQNGALLPTPFLDITSQVANSNDRGLLGIAVHPEFPAKPYVYLLYTWNPPGYSNTAVGARVSRLIRVEADPAANYNVALPGSTTPQTVAGGPGHVILLGSNSTAANVGNPTNGRDTTKASCMTGLTMAGAPVEDCIPSDEDSHSIGTVLFGRDGSLFVGTGDGANYTSVDHRALRSINLNSLAGKITRIDPDTGEGLSDNPFFDATCPQCNRSKVYSMGLRNPFRFAIHPDTNEPWIGDVGWTSWEEINTGKGANFGWPCYEGGAAGSPAPVESGATTSLKMGSYQSSTSTSPTCATLYAQGLSQVRAPVFAYNHSGNDGYGVTGGASANGGSFYAGSVYPATYQNALFIADYNRRWIRYLTFDAQGRATVNNFARETAIGPVQILQGPDTNLYVVALNSSNSQIRRIRYIAGGNTPPTAVATAAPTIGVAPLNVTFSSQGSYDPDAQALSYSWAFGDGATSTQQNPTHVYAVSGTYTATLTVTELTTPFASRTAEVVITAGNEPPLATITAPATGTTYAIGDVITYAGSGSAGGQPIDPANLSWDLRLHHNEHMHFSALPNGAGGSFEIIEHGDNTYYDLCLTSTSPSGASDTQCVELLPETTQVTLATDPAGLFVNYEDEGATQASPLIINPVVGSDQTASVPLIQGGYTFAGWADGEPSTSHPFLVGTTPVTYTANYVNHPPVAVATGAPTSGNVALTVNFTGSGSYDPEFATLTYQWAFGDGTTAAQADVAHTYTTAGTYAAVLTVRDQLDGTASKTVSVTVNPVCGNGAVESGEACDGGACCTAACQFASAVTVCRAAAGACDVAETCSGTAATCPANAAAANGTSCSDGNVCNGAETCQSGSCAAGTALVCNDGNVCTDDTCAPSTGCVFTNNTAACSDGVACTTDVCAGGACQGTSSCVSGGTCNPATGTCDAPAGGYRIWPDNPTPATVDAGPDAAVELGTKFRSDNAGYITGIRFYKSAANVGPHTVSLWNGSGSRLGGTTVNLGNAVGWQEVTLPTAVQIQANTTYVASYHCPTGHYSGTLDYFATAGVDTPPLRALKTGVSGGNGVYAYGAGNVFPNLTYRALNYWVDAMFSPAPPPTLTGIAVSPSGQVVEAGATQPFTATGTYSDGSMQNLNAQVTWASSNTAVATIGSGGLATGVAPGTTTISATLGALSGSTSLTVQAAGTVTITTASLGVGVVGEPYAETLAAGGGTPPYTWSVVSGTLPAGLVLDADTGVISGTPSTGGVSTFTLQVSAAGQTATRGFTISIGQNEIVAENALPGTPPSIWDISGAGDASIQGFATDISVDQGGTVAFKVNTPATSYRIDVYRLGYYGGLGARLVGTVQPSAALPQTQPACLSQPSTGLVDCGNWAVSASWAVPPGATSGIYVAKLVRTDPEDGRASHVPFVVRDDDGGSDVLFQTSDTTWQAYNTYGGASLYYGSAGGRAVKVSYNRPFTTRCCSFPNGSPPSYLFNNEYPMVRWLERNGYDVSYSSGVDTDRLGSELLEHRVYMPVGHDEYWSGAQRTNVEAARAAGVHIAIFSGNHAFWKTRWENSIDGTGTPRRTLVCYKETEAGAKTDPLPGVWTGTWRDPRFGPHDGGRPENELSGLIFTVNGIRYDALEVPADDGKLRFWRNTTVASLGAGQKAVFPTGTLGTEWDEDLDNGFRPAGLVRLSTTTVANVQRLIDYGKTYATATATHHLTLYRHASGALVFGAGTIQWPWGLDEQHDFAGPATDARMQQATVNLLADMSVQPKALQAGLVPATASADTTPPSATITSPANGATVAPGSSVTISGTATDVGGLVGGVEVSTDGGATWHPATGRATWSYVWAVSGSGTASLRARAADDSGNLGAASTAVTVTITAPTLTGMAVTPSAPTVPVGNTQQFTATGTYSDGTTQNLTTQVTWASSATSVATISASGLATTAAAGTTTISATLGAVSGNTTLTAQVDPLVITTASLPAGTVDTAYTATLAATGGIPPYTWSVASGALPSGLTLSGATGVISGTPTAAGTSSFTVQVQAGAVSVTKALAITVNALPTGLTIWPSNPTPAIVDAGPDAAVELGVKFRSDVAGSVRGLRFYKSAANGGTHIGSLWSSGGSRLGFATFTGESGSGWQQVTFANPIAIQANTTYVASYHCPQGHYSGNLDDFLNAGVDTPPLHALKTGVSGGNGVYAYGPSGTFPTLTYRSLNYWVDVVFDAGPAPTLTSIAVTPSAPSLAVGATQQFTATGTYSDGSTQDLTPQVTWASSSPAVATVSAAGLATGVAGGTTTVSATSGAVSGSTTLTVQVAPLSITTTALPGGTVGSAYTTTLAASGGTPPYTWSIASGALPAGLTLNGSTGAIAGTPTTVGTSSFTVQVTAGAQNASKPLSIAVSAGVTGATIWPANPAPAVVDAGPDAAVALGVKFRSDAAGYLTAIRFYKSAANVGPHVVTLWSLGGSALGSATVDLGSASGWQQVTLPSPVQIQANTTYVASYHCPTGHYSGTLDFFTTTGVDTPPLHAVATGGSSGGNGVYGYGPSSTFPTLTYRALNYWVDVVFSTTAP